MKTATTLASTCIVSKLYTNKQTLINVVDFEYIKFQIIQIIDK